MRHWIARPILALGLVAGMFAIASPMAAYAGQSGASGVTTKSQTSLAKDKVALRDLYFSVLAGRTSVTVYQKALRSFAAKYGAANTPSLAMSSLPSTPLCPIVPGGALIASTPSSPNCLGSRAQNTVSLTQAGEQYCSWNGSYCYCGPATAYSMLQGLGYPTSHDGEALSQNTLATTKYLETNYWGNTPWSGLSGDHPMPESLNYWRTSSYSGYYQADGLGTGRPAPDTSTFEFDVIYDVDNRWSVAANITEVVGGYHLAGHPNQNIGHWLPIYGYYSYGANFYYADPANSVPASWGWSAPAYSSDSAANFSGLVQARGVVW